MASPKPRRTILCGRSNFKTRQCLLSLLTPGNVPRISYNERGRNLTLFDSSFVLTDPGNEAARIAGMKEAPVPLKKSVEF